MTTKLSYDGTKPFDYEPPYQLWSHMTLTQIADAYWTDKGTHDHNYTPVYERYLEQFRSKPIRLMEIGVACGASLKMWSRYMPEAKITGVDIRPECADLCKDYPNIEIVIADATKALQPGPWDVIIDDGSHAARDMVETVKLHWDHLVPGGFYIIEDTGCTLPNKLYRVPNRLQGEDERILYSQMIDGFMRLLDWGQQVDFLHAHRQIVIIRKAPTK